MAKNYWKPTTPEQIADFKARRKIINKASKERIKLRQQGLLEAGKMGRGDALTPDQREIRNELQRARREKVKERKAVKLDSSKPVTPQTTRSRKLPIGRKEKPQPKRMANRPDDPNKVKVRLDSRTEVYVMPGYDINELRVKYKIAI